MTNYWMLGTTRNNFNIAKCRGFDIECFQDFHEKTVKKIDPKDGLVYYIWGDCKFGAIVEATGCHFYGETKIFEPPLNNPNEVYHHRFNIQPILVPANDELLNADEVQLKLGFITTKQRAHSWKLAFRPSIKKIPQEDFETINSEMKKSCLFK